MKRFIIALLQFLFAAACSIFYVSFVIGAAMCFAQASPLLGAILLLMAVSVGAVFTGAYTIFSQGVKK
jgi:hypothetical protein